MPEIDPAAPDVQKYSFARALRSMETTDHRKEKVFETEISDELCRLHKRSTGGLLIPTNLAFIPDGQRTTSATAYGATINAGQGGASLVQTQLLEASFIDVLRNKMRVIQMGATIIANLVGNATIPRQVSDAATYWLSPEGTDITEAEGAFDAVTLTPKTVGSRAQYSRQLLLQSTPNVEMLVRNQFARQLALAIDAAALIGTGAAGQPTGIANTAGVTIVAMGTNGAAFASLDPLTQLESAVMNANVDETDAAYLFNSKTVSALKTLKDTTGNYLWANAFPSIFGQGGTLAGGINGYRAYRSNQLPNTLTKGTGTNLSAAIFGNWSDLIIGEWGVLEVLPNPYGSGFNSGTIDIRAMQTIDVKLRHPLSFAAILDIVAP